MTVPSEGPRLVLQQKRCKLSVTRINSSSPNYRPAIFLTWSQSYQLSILPFHPPIPKCWKWCYLSLINYNNTHHVSIYFWPFGRGSLKRPLSTLLESTSKEDSAVLGHLQHTVPPCDPANELPKGWEDWWLRPYQRDHKDHRGLLRGWLLPAFSFLNTDWGQCCPILIILWLSLFKKVVSQAGLELSRNSRAFGSALILSHSDPRSSSNRVPPSG